MRRMYVRLDRREIEALVRLSQAERRHPADQAALLIARALAESGSEHPRRLAAPEGNRAHQVMAPALGPEPAHAA
jgi:hypothetical protein